MTIQPRRGLLLIALALLLGANAVPAQSLKDFQKLARQPSLDKLPQVGVAGAQANAIVYRLKNTTGAPISFEVLNGQTVPALYWEQQRPDGKWIGTLPGEGLVTSERSGIAAGESVDFSVPIDPTIAPARPYIRIFNAAGSKSSFIQLCEIVN